MYKCLYCTVIYMFMTYRVSISESTMDRMRKYAAHQHAGWWKAGEIGKAGNGKFSYTVDDLVCELLRKEGF
jgi:hypothetical protein